MGDELRALTGHCDREPGLTQWQNVNVPYMKKTLKTYLTGGSAYGFDSSSNPSWDGCEPYLPFSRQGKP